MLWLSKIPLRQTPKAQRAAANQKVDKNHLTQEVEISLAVCLLGRETILGHKLNRKLWEVRSKWAEFLPQIHLNKNLSQASNNITPPPIINQDPLLINEDSTQ